jgi:hypothetical protein
MSESLMSHVHMLKMELRSPVIQVPPTVHSLQVHSTLEEEEEELRRAG